MRPNDSMTPDVFLFSFDLALIICVLALSFFCTVNVVADGNRLLGPLHIRGIPFGPVKSASLDGPCLQPSTMNCRYAREG